MAKKKRSKINKLNLFIIIILAVVSVFLTNIFAPSKVYVVVTVDVEQDVVPYLDTYLGVSEGLPKILQLLNESGIKGTFFITGDVAKKYPGSVEKILEYGHEIGGHGLEHERLGEKNYTEKERIVEEMTEILENITKRKIVSFRPPYQSTDSDLTEILEKEGYCAEASFANNDYPYAIENTKIIRLSSKPLFYPSETWPKPWIEVYKETLANQEIFKPKIIVIGIHSWEIIKMPDIKEAEYYTRPTGNYTYENLKELLRYLNSSGVEFKTSREICELVQFQK